MTDWILALFIILAVALLSYHVGGMHGRERGYQQCLGAIDDDAAARAAWRAQR